MTGEIINKIKRNDEVVWRVIDGEIVVLVPAERALHALTGCGSKVWELIETETTVGDIIQKICAEYEVEPQRAREEITEYIHKLAALNLVEIVSFTDEEANH